MVNFSQKSYLGRCHRVIVREKELELKNPTCIPLEYMLHIKNLGNDLHMAIERVRESSRQSTVNYLREGQH